MIPILKNIGLMFGLVFVLFMGEAEALQKFPARLDLEIDSDYCQKVPLMLCIGGDSHCYEINDTCRDTNGCYKSNTCVVAMHTITNFTPQADDHPFVNHPDDWDYVYIRNDSETGFVLQHLKLTLTNLLRSKRVYNLATGTNVKMRGSGDYIFAEWTAITAAGRHFEAGEDVPIFDWVKEQREEHVKAVFCQTANCSNFNTFDDLPLPWSVREQTYDVGQAGIVKYRAWDSGKQLGCDEAFNYYSSQFTNNIHYSCESDGKDCSYFKSWETTTNNYNDFNREQMAKAGRLYKLVFNERSVSCGTGGYPCTNATCKKERTGIRGAYRCTNATCTTIDPNGDDYSPKVGDYFVRIRGNGNDMHTMTLLGEYWFLPAAAATQKTDANNDMVVVPVIHKRGDIIRAEVSTGQGNANQKHGDGCKAPFLYNYYIGEVDHEIDPDGDGPLTSGARPADNGPNFGFRISLIPLY